MVVPEMITPAEALEELREIARLAARDGALPRHAATRYTLCRDRLLQSVLRPSLPGFLLQCLTIARFHDFIHLLDPRLDVRLAFIEEAFRKTAQPPALPSEIDVFGDEDF